MTSVVIAVGTARVHGRLLHAAGDAPAPGVVFVHGWGSSQRQGLAKAKRLQALGCACLTFNLRGHARTWRQRATVTRSENLADLVAAYDCLAGRAEVDAERIGVVGSSYGGYLAVLLAAERKLSWLALEAPAIYKDGDFDRPKRELNLDGDLPGYRRRRLTPAGNRALRTAARFTGDVLLVEGERDQVVPHAVLDNYRRAFKGARSLTHVVIPEADHGLTQSRWRQAYSAALADWVRPRLAR